MKDSHRSLTPRKYIVAHLGLNVLLPGVGLPPRLAYQACQGTLPQITGVPRVSALVATGLTFSGVEEVSSRCTLSDKMAWLARSPARFGSDVPPGPLRSWGDAIPPDPRGPPRPLRRLRIVGLRSLVTHVQSISL